MARLGNTGFRGFISSMKIEAGRHVENFLSGFNGHGWKIWQHKPDKYKLEIDELQVRGRLVAYEYLIKQIRAVRGAIGITQAQGTVKSVEMTGSNYVLTLEEDILSFVANDFIRCQRFSGTSQKFYHVEIASIDVSTGKVYIPMLEFADSDAPEVGDEVVQFGNETDTTRQSAIYIHADEGGKPAIDVMFGINSKNWTNCLKIRIGGDIPGSPGMNGFYCENGKIICKNGSGDIMYSLNPDGSGTLARGGISWDATGAMTWNALSIGGRNLILNSRQMTKEAQNAASNYIELYSNILAGDYVFSIGSSTIVAGTAMEYDVTIYSVTNGHVNTVRLPVSAEKQVWKFTVPQELTNPRLLVYMGINGQTNNNKLLFNEVKLERGTVDTDWTPAPEDGENNGYYGELDFLLDTFAQENSQILGGLIMSGALIIKNQGTIVAGFAGAQFEQANGAESPVLWLGASGAANANQAPFRVYKDGSVFMNKGIFAGYIQTPFKSVLEPGTVNLGNDTFLINENLSVMIPESMSSNQRRTFTIKIPMEAARQGQVMNLYLYPRYSAMDSSYTIIGNNGAYECFLDPTYPSSSGLVEAANLFQSQGGLLQLLAVPHDDTSVRWIVTVGALYRL